MTEVSRADRALRAPAFTWPRDDTMRVPYQVYTDPELYALEQQRLFRGPTWNFLCLEAEIPNSGDYKATHVGDAPVVVVRKMDGGISAVLNRCAHKGAVLCYKPRGNIQEFNCVYHNWVYNLEGKLQAVAFRRGVGGKGGVGADFDQSQHNLEPLRVTTYRGLVFGTFSNLTPSFRDYLGDELLKCVDRVFIKSVKVLGYHSQVLPNNWKLYAENNKDSYHASLLHVFHNTFSVVRANMGGGIKRHQAQRQWLAPSELYRAHPAQRRRHRTREGTFAQGGIFARRPVGDGAPARTWRSDHQFRSRLCSPRSLSSRS